MSAFSPIKAQIIKITTAAILFAQCLFAAPIYKSVGLADGLPIELDLDRVTFFEIKDGIVKVRFADGKAVPLKESLESIQTGINNVLKTLEREQFVPVSRQAIVNPCYLDGFSIFKNTARLKAGDTWVTISRRSAGAIEKLVAEKSITEASEIIKKGKSLRISLLIGFCMLALEAEAQGSTVKNIESSNLKYGFRICPKEFVAKNSKALKQIYCKLYASESPYTHEDLVDMCSGYLDWRVNNNEIDAKYKGLDLNEIFILNELLLSILSDAQIYRNVIPVLPQNYYPGALGRAIENTDYLFKECNGVDKCASSKGLPPAVCAILIVLFLMTLWWFYPQ